MQKVVINSCYGGFGLSPEAILWLFERGYDDDEFKTLVEDYYELDDHIKRLTQWKEYLKDPNKKKSIFLTVFTPDENYVLVVREIARTHPLLIQCIEELGVKANGECAELKIVEIPDGVEYIIEEYDGREHIAEKHRTWG